MPRDFAPMSRCGRPLLDKIGRPRMSIVKRSDGHSAVAALAYITREKIEDERTAEIHNYSRKRADLVAVHTSNWDGDPSELWNTAERAETRRNSQVARSHILPLPSELTDDQMLTLTKNYAEWLAETYGTASTVAIHKPDGRNNNWHAHLLETTRRIQRDDAGRVVGLGEKTREMNDLTRSSKDELPRNKVELIRRRDAWEDFTNQALEMAGIEGRVDFSAYADQIEEGRRAPQEPTQHLGPKAHAYEKAHANKLGTAKGRKAALNAGRRARNAAAREALDLLVPTDDEQRDDDLDALADMGGDMIAAAKRTRRFMRQMGMSLPKRRPTPKPEIAAAQATSAKPAPTAATQGLTDEQERKRRAAIARRIAQRGRGARTR